jgi:hypothetical protein
MKELNVYTLFTILSLFSLSKTNAQDTINKISIGFFYGNGSEDRFPFNSKDYTHEVSIFKVQLNYNLKQKNNWSNQLFIAPEYSKSKHQLINKYFIKHSDSENYLELRELYSKERTISEIGLNIGGNIRYSISKPLSIYALGSIGPMMTNRSTERLPRGFTFVDVFSLGISYKIQNISVDFRYGIRHLSNLNFRQPNHGHNTTNFEFGITL